MVSNIQHGNKLSNKAYNNTQQYLSNQIKQPQNLNDLKRNAVLKARQIQLARIQGDFELAATLAYEHQRILQDINKYLEKS